MQLQKKYGHIVACYQNALKDNTKMDLMSCEWAGKTAYIVWAKGRLFLDKILKGFTNNFSIWMLWFENTT